LRLHMFVILLATALSGVLASKLFFIFGIHSFLIRYPLTVLLAYGVFFLCIKLWLVYVSPKREEKRNSLHLLDGLDAPSCSSPSGSNGSLFQGGGGHFSGAGASGSFDAPSVLGAKASGESLSEGTSGAVDGVLEAAGGAVCEEEGIVTIAAAVVLAVAAAIFFGCAAYVIMEAPIILSEAAFEGLLAVTLIKKTRMISSGDWMGSIVRATWGSFTITLAISLLAAMVLHDFYPEATRLVDVLR